MAPKRAAAIAGTIKRKQPEQQYASSGYSDEHDEDEDGASDDGASDDAGDQDFQVDAADVIEARALDKEDDEGLETCEHEYAYLLDTDAFDTDSDDEGGASAGGGGISQQEKAARLTIQEMLMNSGQACFFEQLTKGLLAYVLLEDTHNDEQAVGLLLDKSFHRHEELGPEIKHLICKQTLLGMATMKERIGAMSEESHRIFCTLAEFRQSRIVRVMITRLSHVVAGIFILQLSLDQIGSGLTKATQLCEAAIAGQTALIDSLQAPLPLPEALCQICNMVIANAQHVQRRLIYQHIQVQRVEQLYDKPPSMKGIAARCESTGLFFVVVKVAVVGNQPANGGCAAFTELFGMQYAKSGQVSRLPAEVFDPKFIVDSEKFPFQMTTCAAHPLSPLRDNCVVLIGLLVPSCLLQHELFMAASAFACLRLLPEVWLATLAGCLQTLHSPSQWSRTCRGQAAGSFCRSSALFWTRSCSCWETKTAGCADSSTRCARLANLKASRPLSRLSGSRWGRFCVYDSPRSRVTSVGGWGRGVASANRMAR